MSEPVVDLTAIPLSKFVESRGEVYISGQVPLTPDGAIIEGDVTVQTAAVLASIGEVLTEVGLSKEDIVKTTVYLTNVKRDFHDMNAAYAEFFGGHRPARTTVGVELAIDVHVEIDAVAHRGHAPSTTPEAT